VYFVFCHCFEMSHFSTFNWKKLENLKIRGRVYFSQQIILIHPKWPFFCLCSELKDQLFTKFHRWTLCHSGVKLHQPDKGKKSSRSENSLVKIFKISQYWPYLILLTLMSSKALESCQWNPPFICAYSKNTVICV